MNRWLLSAYKRWVSPLLHAVAGCTGACRFQPTCSEYAAIAVHAHGLVRGSRLALGRVLRCHPLCRGGFDPVPGTGFDVAGANRGLRHEAFTMDTGGIGMLTHRAQSSNASQSKR